MRKAFETNVPRLKPRLRSAIPAGQAEIDPDPAAQVGGAAAEAIAAPVPVAADVAPPVIVTRSERPGAGTGAAMARAAASGDVTSRRDRLDKIKRRVADAARPSPRIEPVPADPARAAASVLALVGELEGELGRSREREEALRADLDGARGELARAASEARGAAERLAVAEGELVEKRGVLTELLAEMEALEQERDESVRRAQALAAIDEERAKLLEDVSRRAEEEARLRAEREAELERLGEELRDSASDGARLRTAVGELARERDQLAAELDRTRTDRDELVAAKRALEQVHAALAQARAKLV
jgi:chromosome segregation ATPase